MSSSQSSSSDAGVETQVKKTFSSSPATPTKDKAAEEAVSSSATLPEEEEGEEKMTSEAEYQAAQDEWWEREFREHPFSAAAAAASSSTPLLSAAATTTAANEASGESFRPLEEGEELLTESEPSSEDEEPYWQWRARADRGEFKMSLEEKQEAMDMDKEWAAGNLEPDPVKSVLQMRSIGDTVEWRRRHEWAATMKKAHHGRYVPYPGRPAREPPSHLSAAEKRRQLQRKK